MINLANSRSLTDFQRNARSFLEGINRTREPLLLTVNGQVQAVMLDPETFRAFHEFLEREHFVTSLREGLKDLDEGHVVPLDTLETELKARYGF
jgi:PHD/YefM family antitoxin component YafN of YafNO toxin-antitoxin module